MVGIVLLSLLGWGVVYSLAFNDDDDAPAKPEEDVTPENGTSGDDFLDGNDGDNRLFGNDGDDVMAGGEGNDSLFGGAGQDAVFGEGGDDLLRGSADDDVIFGGKGEDTLRGDGGDDILQSVELIDEEDFINDIRTAITEDDITPVYNTDLEVGEADTLHGGFGNDSLFFGSNDEATGGGGKDEFIVGDWMIPGEEAIVTDYVRGIDTLLYQHDVTADTPVVSFGETEDGDAEVRIDDEVVMVLQNVDFGTLRASDVTLVAYTL